MSVPDNEVAAGRAATPRSRQQNWDRKTMPNTLSASLEVNPFVGEGGAYDSVRPAYPDEAVAALIDAARRARGADASGQGGPLRAADIGAGTGKMSELLARGGLLVDAVEPSEAMRAQASSIEGVTWHGGVAEETGLPNDVYDIVVFAQSWHWVDSERAGLEAARILAPGGALAIVWNQMAVSIPWVHRLTRIMRSGDVHRPDNPPTPGGGFAPMTLTQVAWEDRMTPEQILALGTTRSSYIRSSEAGRARMQENLRWYLYDHLGYAPGEQVTIPYATLVWLTHL
ncbi:class I SAM-dependent methyltransferase [Schaalia sp. ORNL0103]|uniref:class I SAM-dependent methyltransferase n=2 Tax=Bacteria TaxID=2 RepID=UPI001C67766F|nr:class I SAM-dependent methyltransferase [Schaalia sp. ORNL0103]MBW6413463.1 class I SAM-dependent methyltransferase [Schaalia sp. ORNL0103]